MSGLLVIPLIRTIQWSFESVHYGDAGHVRRTGQLRPCAHRRAIRRGGDVHGHRDGHHHRDPARAGLHRRHGDQPPRAARAARPRHPAHLVRAAERSSARWRSPGSSTTTSAASSTASSGSWRLAGALVHRPGAQRDPHHRQHRLAHAAVRDAHHPGRAPGRPRRAARGRHHRRRPRCRRTCR